MSRAETKAATRSRIVEAALDELIEVGYAGARLESIARRASVSIGNLFWHFRNKEDLCLSILRPTQDAMLASLRSVESVVLRFEKLESISPELDAFLRTNARFLTQHRKETFVLFERAVGTPFLGLRAELVHFAADLVRQAVEQEARRCDVKPRYDPSWGGMLGNSMAHAYADIALRCEDEAEALHAVRDVVWLLFLAPVMAMVERQSH